MFSKKLLCAIACAIAFSTSPLMAHDGATGVVKERMDLMKTIGKNTKAIAPIAMGSAEMNLKAVEEAATTISNAAKEAVTKFPEGSHTKETAAKIEVWAKWDEFAGLMKSLETDSAKLAAMAKAGEEFELIDGFNKMISNCKNCHTKFRNKKD